MNVAEIIAIVLGGGILGTVGYIVNGMDKKSEKGDDAILSKMKAEFERLDQGRKEDREQLQTDIDRLDRMDEARRDDVRILYKGTADHQENIARLQEKIIHLEKSRAS